MSFIAHLRTVSLFSGLNERQLNLIQANLKKVAFHKRSVILQQDEESFDLYIILSGAVSVTLIHPDGREVTLDMMKEGDFFGELSLLDGKPRSATVTAVTDVEVLVLRRSLFIEILKGNADIAINLIAVMSRRLRKANETIETLTFLDVSGRVAKALIDAAVLNGEKLPDGCIRFHCPTHQSIANNIGCSREAVTKALKAFAANGLIKMTAKEVVITPKQFEIL